MRPGRAASTRVPHPPDGRGDIEACRWRVPPDQAIDVRERFTHARIAPWAGRSANLTPDQARKVRAAAQAEPPRRAVESAEQALLHGHKDLRHWLEYIRISDDPCQSRGRSTRTQRRLSPRASPTRSHFVPSTRHTGKRIHKLRRESIVATQTTAPTRKTAPLQVTSIMIGVKDLARSKKFYGEGLGGKIEKDYPNFVEIKLGEGSSSLALYEREAAAKDAGVSSEGSGFRGVSFHFIVPSKEAVSSRRRARRTGRSCPGGPAGGEGRCALPSRRHFTA